MMQMRKNLGGNWMKMLKKQKQQKKKKKKKKKKNQKQMRGNKEEGDLQFDEFGGKESKGRI